MLKRSTNVIVFVGGVQLEIWITGLEQSMLIIIELNQQVPSGIKKQQLLKMLIGKLNISLTKGGGVEAKEN